MHTKVILVCSKVAERGGEGIAQVPRQWGTIHGPSLVQPSLEGGSSRGASTETHPPHTVTLAYGSWPVVKITAAPQTFT